MVSRVYWAEGLRVRFGLRRELPIQQETIPLFRILCGAESQKLCEESMIWFICRVQKQ